MLSRFLVDVTKCNHLHVGFDLSVLKHQAKKVRSPGAYPDHRHIDTIIRSQYPGPGGHGEHLCSGGCRLEKAAS
jgi:hypothetical protein